MAIVRVRKQEGGNVIRWFEDGNQIITLVKTPFQYEARISYKRPSVRSPYLIPMTFDPTIKYTDKQILDKIRYTER